MQLQIQSRITPQSVQVVRCEGRIVFGPETDLLHKTCGPHIEDRSGLVLDLSRVSHIDSCGVGAVVGLMVSVRNRGGDLRLVHPSAKVKEVLKLTHILELLRVFEDEDAAVASFTDNHLKVAV